MAVELTDSCFAAPEKTLVDYGLEIVPSEKPVDDGHLLHWPYSLNRDTEESFDVTKLQEQAEQLEIDLIRKEEETRSVLQQLEETRKFVEGLKANLLAESSPLVLGSGSSLAELTRIRSNFNKASVSLAIIQASVESLNKKLRIDGLPVDNSKVDTDGILSLILNTIAETKEEGMVVNVVADQLKKMKDASRCEVVKAMREIESTKKSIKMAEMRLNAAKKMKEAAMAVEAIAVAERRGAEDPLGCDPLQKPEGFVKLMDKKDVRRPHQKEITILGKFYEEKPRQQEADRDIYCRRRTHGENGPPVSKSEVSNPTKLNHRGRRKQSSESKKEWPAISIGAILTRKLILEGDHHQNGCIEKGHVSLGQMLREPGKFIAHLSKPAAPNGNVDNNKRVVVQRNTYEFISNPLYSSSVKRASWVNPSRR